MKKYEVKIYSHENYIESEFMATIKEVLLFIDTYKDSNMLRFKVYRDSILVYSTKC